MMTFTIIIGIIGIGVARLSSLRSLLLTAMICTVEEDRLTDARSLIWWRVLQYMSWDGETPCAEGNTKTSWAKEREIDVCTS